MRVLVCGGRDFANLPERTSPEWDRKEKEHRFVLSTLDRLSDDWPKTPEDEYGNWLPAVTIISGGAKGVDDAALDWAMVNWTDYIEFTAEWETYGRAAGPIRNKKMIDDGQPDLVVAFPGGRGTANMVSLARQYNIPVMEIKYELASEATPEG